MVLASDDRYRHRPRLPVTASATEPNTVACPIAVTDTAAMTQGTHDQPEGMWRVLLQTVGGTEVRPGQRIEVRHETSEFGPFTVTVWTRFEDTGLAVPLPRETFLEVMVPADSADDAIASAGAI